MPAQHVPLRDVDYRKMGVTAGIKEPAVPVKSTPGHLLTQPVLFKNIRCNHMPLSLMEALLAVDQAFAQLGCF